MKNEKRVAYANGSRAKKKKLMRCVRGRRLKFRQNLYLWRRIVSEIFPLEEELNFGETRSLDVIASPAFLHQLVNVFRTRTRPLQISDLVVRLVVIAVVFDHLFVGVLGEWPLRAQHQYLP